MDPYRRFVDHIKNDRPEWFQIGQWIRKDLLVAKFNEFNGSEVSIDVLMKELKRASVFSEISNGEKRRKQNGTRYQVFLAAINAPINPIPRAPPAPIIHVAPALAEQTDGHLYIIQEREFKRLGEHTYKIGKTTRDLVRFKQYPKGSILCMMISSPNIDRRERILINLFKERFQHRPEYGSEYFSGNLNDMKRVLLEVSLD